MDIKKISKKKSVIFTIIKGIMPALIIIMVIWFLTQGSYLLGHGISILLGVKGKDWPYWFLGYCGLIVMSLVFFLLQQIFYALKNTTEYCKMCSRFARLPLTQYEFDEVTKNRDLYSCLIFFLNSISFINANGNRFFIEVHIMPITIVPK